MKWDYRVVTFDAATWDDPLTSHLNYLGENGWELVSMSTFEAHARLRFVFKRPRNYTVRPS
jgi:hypothetical protein